MKGHRPTDDPEWHHEHVPTGEVRKCATDRCKASWKVTCHAGRRRYCDVCRAGIARRSDRERKQIRRRDARDKAKNFISTYGITLAEAKEAARHMSHRDYADWMAELEEEKCWADQDLEYENDG